MGLTAKRVFKTIITASLISSLTISYNVSAQKIGDSYAQDRAVVRSLSKPNLTMSQKNEIESKVKEIADHYSKKEDYLSLRLVFNIYNDKNTRLYSKNIAEIYLDKIAQLNNGAYSKFTINYYLNEDSPYHNLSKALEYTRPCAELGDETCLTTVFYAAWKSKAYRSSITEKMKVQFDNLARTGLKDNNSKFTYFQSVSLKTLPNRGIADKLLFEAADDMHTASLRTVAGLLKQDYYKDKTGTKKFYYNYIVTVVDNNLSDFNLNELAGFIQRIPKDEVAKLMNKANEKLIAAGYTIPDVFK